jgi:hypothetical protein
MARLRNAWRDIEAALRKRPFVRTHQCLNEDGFAITYKALSTYVAALRRESSHRSVGPQKPTKWRMSALS